jgi:hypothetical protein
MTREGIEALCSSELAGHQLSRRIMHNLKPQSFTPRARYSESIGPSDYTQLGMSLAPLHWLQKGRIVPHCCPAIRCYVQHTTTESQISRNTTIRLASPEAWPRVCVCTLQWPLPRLTPTPQNNAKQRRLPRRSVCGDDGPVRCPAKHTHTQLPFHSGCGMECVLKWIYYSLAQQEAETDSIAAPACQELGAELKPLEI